jgi:hypothetical protein
VFLMVAVGLAYKAEKIQGWGSGPVIFTVMAWKVVSTMQTSILFLSHKSQITPENSLASEISTSGKPSVEKESKGLHCC